MKRQTVPWTITFLRVVALPFFIYSFNQQIHTAMYTLFLFAVCTDVLDGYTAKKLEATSTLGAYFDAAADFLFVSCVFLVFVFEQLYPLWVLLLIVAVFVQFVLTNLFWKRAVYDLVGKYYGSLMFGGIGLTLLFPEQQVYSIVTVGVVVSTAASLFSRLASFLRAKNRK